MLTCTKSLLQGGQDTPKDVVPMEEEDEEERHINNTKIMTHNYIVLTLSSYICVHHQQVHGDDLEKHKPPASPEPPYPPFHIPSHLFQQDHLALPVQ